MTKHTLVRPLAPRWLRGAAWLDDDKQLVYMDRGRAEAYQPLQHPTIGAELTRVRTPADVLAFVTTFGLLKSSAVWDLRDDATVYEPVYDFIKAAQQLRAIVATIRDVRRAAKGDVGALDRLCGGAEVKERRSLLTETSSAAAEQLAKGIGDAAPYLYDRAYVGEPVEPGQIRVGLMPATLLATCYLQIAFALAEKEPIELCLECGRVFVVEDARQKFCSATCGNRARFRRFQEQQPKKTKHRKQAAHGKTTRTR